MKKLKRVNRGIVLGLILIIVMTGYVIMGNIRFQKEKPLIKETIENYISDFDKLNITPEEFRSSGKNVYADFKADYAERLKAVADRYWVTDTSYHHSDGWSVSKKQLCNMLSSSDNYKGNYTTEYESSVSGFIILRDSEYTASVTCKVSSVYKGILASADNMAKSRYYSDMLFLYSPQGNRIYQYDAHVSEDTITASDDFYLTFTLKRTNDGWKILYCS